MTKVKVLKNLGFKLMLKKTYRFFHERMLSGSFLFQSLGAETENALDP